MALNEDSARHIAEQFLRGEPDARFKESRTVSRRQLVRTLHEAIMAKRRAGYSFEGIVAHLGELGAAMSVSTLKTYLRDAQRHRKANTRPDARKDTRETVERTQTENATRNRRDKRGHRAEGSRGKETELPPRTQPGRETDAPQVEVADATDHGVAIVEGAPGGKQVDPPPTDPKEDAARTTADAVAERAEEPAREPAARSAPTPPSSPRYAPTVPVPATSTGSFGFVPRNR